MSIAYAKEKKKGGGNNKPLLFWVSPLINFEKYNFFDRYHIDCPMLWHCFNRWLKTATIGLWKVNFEFWTLSIWYHIRTFSLRWIQFFCLDNPYTVPESSILSILRLQSPGLGKIFPHSKSFNVVEYLDRILHTVKWAATSNHWFTGCAGSGEMSTERFIL